MMEPGLSSFPVQQAAADPSQDIESVYNIPAVMQKLLFAVTTLLQMSKPN